MKQSSAANPVPTDRFESTLAGRRSRASVETSAVADIHTLVLYCNGAWCGQSPTNIRQLLALGYPAHKLKCYRGGMQSWKALGLTTVEVKAPPKSEAPQ